MPIKLEGPLETTLDLAWPKTLGGDLLSGRFSPFFDLFDHLLDHYFMMDNPWILFFLDLSFHNDKSLKDDDPVMWILMDHPFIDDAKTDHDNGLDTPLSMCQVARVLQVSRNHS